MPFTLYASDRNKGMRIIVDDIQAQGVIHYLRYVAVTCAF